MHHLVKIAGTTNSIHPLEDWCTAEKNPGAKLRVNWRTGAVIRARDVDPLEACHGKHGANERNFLGDAVHRSSYLGEAQTYVPEGSLQGILNNTPKWCQAGKTAAWIPHVPELVNFSRSGVRQMKQRKLKPSAKPKEVPFKPPSDLQGQTEDESPLTPLTPLTPLMAGRKSQKTPREQNIQVDQLPEVLKRLLFGDGVQDMISATSQLLILLQGDSKNAASARTELSRSKGVLRNLVKLIKLCQGPYQVHKPMVMKTLSQVVFYNKTNCDLLASDAIFLGQLISAVESGVHPLQMETMRLMNNLIASSALAAEKLCNHPGMLEAIKSLFANPNFVILFRTASAVNCLTRHAMSQPKIGTLLSRADIVNTMISSRPTWSSEELAATGIPVEQQRLYGFLVTCAVGNSMGTIERKTWEVDEYHLETAVLVLRAARGNRKMAGVTWQMHPVLLTLRCLAVSDGNKKALVKLGLIEELAELVETWKQDPETDLEEQLHCLELSMMLLLKLITVDGTVLIQAKLFETDVINRLRNLDFGPSLFKRLRSQLQNAVVLHPLSRAIKVRTSHTAVELARKLIEELKLTPDETMQTNLGLNVFERDVVGRDQSQGSFSTSSRMIGTSHSIPRSSYTPDWERPLTAGAGGGPPSIPPKHSSPEPRRHTSAEFEYVFDNVGYESAGHPPKDLWWNNPSQGAVRMMFRAHILGNWRRLRSDLLNLLLQRSGKRGVGIAAVDLYKVLGGHRIWFEADDWRDFVQAFSPSNTLQEQNHLDLHVLLQQMDIILGVGNSNRPKTMGETMPTSKMSCDDSMRWRSSYNPDWERPSTAVAGGALKESEKMSSEEWERQGDKVSLSLSPISDFRGKCSGNNSSTRKSVNYSDIIIDQPPLQKNDDPRTSDRLFHALHKHRTKHFPQEINGQDQTNGPSHHGIDADEHALLIQHVKNMLLMQVEADTSTVCEVLSSCDAVGIFQLQMLLKSVGWVLSKSELERIRQTLESDDGHVSACEFIQAITQATQGGQALVSEIATSGYIAANLNAFGTEHEASNIEKQKTWKKKLQRNFVKEQNSNRSQSEILFNGQTESVSSLTGLSSNSSFSMPPFSIRSRLSRAATALGGGRGWEGRGREWGGRGDRWLSPGSAKHLQTWDFTIEPRKCLGEPHLCEPSFFSTRYDYT